MARLSKGQVLESPLNTEEFEAWGGSILIGEWPVERTAEVMDMFASVGNTGLQDPEILVKIFVLGCVDPVFTESDIPELLKKSGAVVMQIVTRIMALNGLTQEALDEARGKS